MVKLFSQTTDSTLKRLIPTCLIVVLFLYSLFFRTYNIDENFFLYGDQIRDWKIAQGGFTDLPLTGTPRGLDGTFSYGPIFYWVLWLIRIIVGPFFNNLPHAGGIGLAFLHALADSFLLFAMIKTYVPVIPAFTIGLILVSSPFESSLSGLIWNPGLAVSFVNLTTGLFLLACKKPSLLKFAFITATGLFAFHSHTPAVYFSLVIFITLPLLCILSENISNKHFVVVMGLVIIILQIPYMLFLSMHPEYKSHSSVIESSITSFLFDFSLFHPLKSFDFLSQSMNVLLFQPYNIPFFKAWILISICSMLFYHRKKPFILAIAIMPVILAWIGYSVFNKEFDTYWLMVLMTPFSMMLIIGITDTGLKSLGKVLSIVLLAFAIFSQPGRFKERLNSAVMPSYHILVKGVKQIVKERKSVGEIKTFRGKDKDAARFLFNLSGGSINKNSNISALIKADGNVEFFERLEIIEIDDK